MKRRIPFVVRRSASSHPGAYVPLRGNLAIGALSSLEPSSPLTVPRPDALPQTMVRP
jgi:hypothetical protein